jgi:hypothetical protein
MPERKGMKTQEQLDRLTGVVESLAASVVAHDGQIGNLIALADKHWAEIVELRRSISELQRSIAQTDKLWQAYLKRLPPQ